METKQDLPLPGGLLPSCGEVPWGCSGQGACAPTSMTLSSAVSQEAAQPLGFPHTLPSAQLLLSVIHQEDFQFPQVRHKSRDFKLSSKGQMHLYAARQGSLAL